MRALEPVAVLTLSRDDFLGTLCGQTASRRVADTVAMERLATWPTGGGWSEAARTLRGRRYASPTEDFMPESSHPYERPSDPAKRHSAA